MIACASGQEALDAAPGAGADLLLLDVMMPGMDGPTTLKGLRAMGIANEIVHLAFGLTLGSVAVAVALSFGLGGREAAGKLMERWLERWKE